MRYDDGWSSNSNPRHCPSLAFDVDVDTAGSIYEITLFYYELENSFNRRVRQRSVVDQVSSQCARRAASRRIFRDVVIGGEHSCVGPRRADLERFARERAASGTGPFVNFRQQGRVYFTTAQVC